MYYPKLIIRDRLTSVFDVLKEAMIETHYNIEFILQFIFNNFYYLYNCNIKFE